MALDFRIRKGPGEWFSAEQLAELHDRLKWGLGPHYDVVLEKDHLHIEYDPKETKDEKVLVDCHRGSCHSRVHSA